MTIATLRNRALLAALIVVTAFCAGLVYKQYLDVKEQSAVIQSRIFRISVAVFQELWYVERIVDNIIEKGHASEEDLFQFSKHVDFLYVRADELMFSANNQSDLDQRTRSVVKGLREIIELADSQLSSDFADPAVFKQEIRGQVIHVGQEVMELFDKQYTRQAAAVFTQVAFIEKLTFSSLALLCLFGTIALGSVLLYQRQSRAQRQRDEAQNKANFLAYYDGLTGLPNRDMFRRSAQKMMDEGSDPVIFLFDLDDFKLVNDIHGHLAGDAVLLHCGNVLREWTEKFGGMPSRLGGDEFAAVIPGPMSSMKIASICEMLLDSISTPFEFEGSLLAAKMSVGVATAWCLEPQSAHDLSAHQKAADLALYRAKEQGKNSYAFFDGDLAELAARRREIEIGIADSLENGGFELAFQPQVSMDDGEIKGFEALMRLTRDGVPISPGEFIPVAEATGQVVDIDLWGLRTAVQEAANWIREGYSPTSVSANLSPLHFRSDEIVGHVKEAISASGLPPHLLTLEITESVLIEDFGKVEQTLSKLRSLGVRIALDDFGTGYSSLGYLRKLDVDYIKIDQSFVRDLEESSETQLILDALVGIAKGLKKSLVVEGIETDKQAEIVRALGCDVGQGYLWGRPMPQDDVRERLRTVADVVEQAISA